MKFTEGYWLLSERTNGQFASQAYHIEAMENGLRVVAPTSPVLSRGDTLNRPTITIEFLAVSPEVISVRAWHYEGYRTGEARFEKKETTCDAVVTITENEAVLDAGRVSVHVDRKNWGYSFWADGKLLTSSGFHNLGYVRWDRSVSSMLPQDNYMKEHEYTPYMTQDLLLAPGENVYGFGERFTAFVKNGQVVETWNEDGGTASQVAYKNIPFYMTNRGYGVFVDHTGNVSFEVASEKVEYVGFSVPGEELRYYLFYGPTHKEILKAYTGLTGRPALPPAWSFGLWLSTSFTTDYDEQTVTSFLEGMEERKIPLSVFHFDCFWMKGLQWCDFEWDPETFPDVKGMLQRYHERGLKICVWINPYIAQGTKTFREAAAGGYLLKRADGHGIWQTDNWQNGMGVVDFTNPKACKWYQGKLRSLLEMGVDCFKTDFGERIPTDCVYYDGSDPVKMHNYYTYMYNKTVHDVIAKKKGEKEAILFARSATAGGQKFPVHWGGDCWSDYESMEESLRGGLSLTSSGFGFWSHDIGGFESTSTPDVYKRWCAFGLLSTHSRLHGSTSYRVPWAYDEEAVDVVRYFAKLKARLMPYLYRNAIETAKTGVPMMRSMVLEFTEDRNCAYLASQYMLGDSLLVAPIFNEDGIAEYYLPEGRWTSLLSGDVKEGGRWYKEKHGYLSIPLYVREGSIVAMGARDDNAVYDYADGTTFRVYALDDGCEAQTTVYDTENREAVKAAVTHCGSRYEIQVSGGTEVKVALMHAGMPKTVSCAYEMDGDHAVIAVPKEGNVTVEF